MSHKKKRHAMAPHGALPTKTPHISHPTMSHTRKNVMPRHHTGRYPRKHLTSPTLPCHTQEKTSCHGTTRGATQENTYHLPPYHVTHKIKQPKSHLKYQTSCCKQEQLTHFYFSHSIMEYLLWKLTHNKSLVELIYK